MECGEEIFLLELKKDKNMAVENALAQGFGDDIRFQPFIRSVSRPIQSLFEKIRILLQL